ncbi:MAG: HIT domain-containing protein [Candidatus Woesearchaeota archaeon]
MNNCPFCKIAPRHTIIVKKFKYCYICFSNPRLMKGHLLVIPYRHVIRPAELKKEELNEIMHVTIMYQEKILKKYWGCDIKENCRPSQKQDRYKVDHLHIHLQPREFKDELYKKVQIHQGKVFKELTKKEAEEFLKFLK